MEEFTTIEEAKNDLLSCAIYLAGNINSNEAQAETIKPIVQRFLEKNDVDNGAHFADVVNDSFVRNQLLIGVIAKCVELEDEEYAWQLIEAIDEYGTQATAKETIALQKAAKGEFEMALEIAGNLEHSSIAYAGIAVEQAREGLETETGETLKLINFNKSRVEALEQIAIHFLKKENNEKAHIFLDQAFLEAEEIEFTEDRIRAYLELANLYTETGVNDKAIECLGKAKSETDKLDGTHRELFNSNIAVGFLKAGSIDLADRTLDEVLDKTQVSNCLLGFSQIFEQDGEREEAIDTLEESYAILKSQQESEIRDSKARYQLFGAIATQFAKLEKTERAIEIAQENPDEFQRNFALTNIAQTSILQGNDEMADLALKGIQSDSQRLSALVAMSDAKNQAEKKDDAVALLNEAATLVEMIPQFIARSETQNELAKRFGFYGELDRSRELASESLSTIEEILGDNNRSIALTELSAIYDKYEFTPSNEDKEVLETLVRKSDW